ncbi:aryl-sulfate sulfotransferase [Chloroflexota bacterium]
MSYARTSLKGVMFYDSRRAYNGVTLFTPTDGKGAWLIDMLGRLVNHWAMDYKPGCDAKLLPNGNLLYAGKVTNGPLVDLEGAGGILLEVDWEANVVWEYKDPYLHHAFDRTKNGNTLILKWVEVPDDIAVRVKGGDSGTECDGIMWGDAIQEITADGKVVWEWIAHKYLDPDVTPHCPICPRSTWTHANAVSELPDGNIIISFAQINTIAIIDKQTGKLKWQWGPWDRVDKAESNLAHQHCPTMLDNGNVLVFNNNMHPGCSGWGFSRVLEVNPRNNAIVWTYGGGENETCLFYSSMLGSCQRLPNGNTLICEGTTGRIFEVTPRSELVWEFSNDLPSYEPPPAQTRSHMVCSAYRYGMDYSGLKGSVSGPIVREAAPDTIAKTEENVKTRLALLGY